MNRLFPIFLKLEQLNVLVVGGGNVGLEKLSALLSNAPMAHVTVVAPYIKPEIKEMVACHPHLTLVERKFEWDDLNLCQLVICATDNKELHLQIYHTAKRRKILINVADTPELCDFYLSSIVQKGDVKIAISTNGKSPTLAKRLKENINEALPEAELDQLLVHLQTFREQLKGDFAHKVAELNKFTESLMPKKE